MESSLEKAINSFDADRLFASETLTYLHHLRLCYGGAGVKAFLMRHKDIQKYLAKYLHNESVRLSDEFKSLTVDKF